MCFICVFTKAISFYHIFSLEWSIIYVGMFISVLASVVVCTAFYFSCKNRKPLRTMSGNGKRYSKLRYIETQMFVFMIENYSSYISLPDPTDPLVPTVDSRSVTAAQPRGPLPRPPRPTRDRARTPRRSTPACSSWTMMKTGKTKWSEWKWEVTFLPLVF